MNHRDKAVERLEAIDDAEPMIQLGIAGIYAMLHIADSIQHGLRDIIYELRS